MPIRGRDQCVAADTPLVCAWNGFGHDGSLNCCTFEGSRCSDDRGCCGLNTCDGGFCSSSGVSFSSAGNAGIATAICLVMAFPLAYAIAFKSGRWRNVMLVLGGQVNGGKIYGAWPGLQDLDQNQDLKITTDYRMVLSEILVRRLDNPKLGTVFPGFTGYKPLGLTGSAADDLPIDYSSGYKMYLPLTAR